MQIRPATEKDIPGIHDLLIQVCNVHADGRPDLFVRDARKYTDEELARLIHDPARPIFVAVDDAADGTHTVLGHAFCELQDLTQARNFRPDRELYLDDLCVSEKARGRHVGEALCQAVRDFAKKEGCYRLTLHVWTCNPKAQGFYEHLGFKPYMLGMEEIL